MLLWHWFAESMRRPQLDVFQPRLWVGKRGSLARFAMLLSVSALLTFHVPPGHAGFVAAPAYSVGFYATSVAVGDFNGDGIPDLAVVADPGVSILLGKGDGTFQPARVYNLAYGTECVAVGDFNGDGILDLVVNNWPSDTVTILLGKGDGSFHAGQSYPAGLGPHYVVVGDINGDGILDLAVANTGHQPDYHGTVTILLGNGNGTFQPAQTFDVGAQARAVALGDFNGDGIPDLAVATSTVTVGGNTLSLLLGNGDGTFGAAQNYAVGTSHNCIAVADFNGDGIPDLVLENYSYPRGTVSVLLGRGDGTFLPARNYPVGTNPSAVSVGDFNGDGNLDLAVANQSGTVTILLGNGDGSFYIVQEYAVGALPDAIAVGDFNSDGSLDLAVVSMGTPSQGYHDGSVNILLGKGNGLFQAAPSYFVPNSAQHVAVGDFNGDGIPDLAVANGDTNTVSVLLGKGDGTFQATLSFVAGTYPTSVAVGDFNGDGIPDLAVAESGGMNGRSAVGIWLGNGDGTFRHTETYAVAAFFVTVGDFNGDGTADLAVVGGRHGASPGIVSILLGYGDGTFQAAQSYTVGLGPDAVAVGDFNGDGILDLVVANFADASPQGTVSVLLGNGDGTFQRAQEYAVGAFPTSVAVGDFNGDGRLDLAVANAGTAANHFTDASVSILLGKGDGSFQAAHDFGTGHGSTCLVVADFNGDGIPDLAVGDGFSDVVGLTGSSLVTVFIGKGDGRFPTSQNYAAGGDPVFLAVGDFSRDGYLDLVVANSVSFGATWGGVTVLINAADW